MFNRTQTTIARRDFVKGAAVTAAAAMTSSSVVLADEAAAPAEPNRVCQILGIEKPVVQAVMLGLMSIELTAAVSEAGGLGILAPGSSAEDIQAARALTSKPFGICVYSYDEETAAMLKEESVDIVLFTSSAWQAGNENDFTHDLDPIKAYKEAGFTVIFKELNATPENTVAAVEAGADVIAVIGFGAGGSGPCVVSNTAEHIVELKQYVDVPLLAAGGIVNAATAAFAAAAGAEGAYAGTRFLASDEAPAAEATKQLIVATQVRDLKPAPYHAMGCDWFTLLTPSPLRDALFDEVAHGADSLEVIVPMVQQAYVAMATGAVEENGISVGVGVGMIDSILPAAEIVDELARGFGM